MKKTYILTTLAAVAAACAPKINFEEEAGLVLDTPEYEDVSSVSMFRDEDNVSYSLEFTESGKYLLTAYLPDVDMPRYKYGVYEAAGDSFLLDGEDIITVDSESNTAEMTFAGTGRSITFASPIPYDGTKSKMTHNVCRSWVPEKTVLIIRPDGLPDLGAEFDRCDLGEILNGIVGMGANLKNFTKNKKHGHLVEEAIKIREDYKDRTNGLLVTDITFTCHNTFIVGFQDREPYVGTWRWEDEENGIFWCSLCLADNDGVLEEVSSTGQIRFNSEASDITLDASFTSKGVVYKASVDFICRQLDNNFINE